MPCPNSRNGLCLRASPLGLASAPLSLPCTPLLLIAQLFFYSNDSRSTSLAGGSRRCFVTLLAPADESTRDVGGPSLSPGVHCWPQWLVSHVLFIASSLVKSFLVSTDLSDLGRSGLLLWLSLSPSYFRCSTVDLGLNWGLWFCLPCGFAFLAALLGLSVESGFFLFLQRAVMGWGVRPLALFPRLWLSLSCRLWVFF